MTSISDSGHPPPRLVRFQRITRFRQISRFERVYPRFQLVAEHVLEEKWELLGAFMALTVASELVLAFLSPLAGLIMHALLLLAVLIGAGFLSIRSEPMSHFMTALSIVPLIRIVSLTTPLGRFSYVQWFVIIGVVLFLALWGLVRTLRPAPEDLGLRMPSRRHLPLEALVVLAAVPIGVAEFLLIRPGPVLETSSLVLLVGPALLMILMTGILEEVIFRGLLARYAGPVFGALGAIVIPAAAQTALDVGYGNALHAVVILATGLFYGFVAGRTRSIVGVGVSHGLVNVLFFLVLPVTGIPGV